ncbi:hypothetical protein ACLOJK_021294 [Asimina triloba]
MSLTGAKMSEEVWLTCITHALSTETEEIMGLLLGDIKYSSSGHATALIWGASPQTRSDRRKDRVETNPEQLAAASAQAEISIFSLSLRILSFSGIHDVRTQAMYQLLDAGFIGLIFSCFSEDAQKVIAFQSLDGKQKHVSRSLPLSPATTSSVIEVESSWSSSENALSTSASTQAEGCDRDTGDSRAAGGSTKGGGKSSDLGEFFSQADINYAGRERGADIQNTTDIDSMDMSPSMQEAMHRSNLDMSGAEYIRKEIPLQVLPTQSLIKLDSPLASFTQLQRVLFEEERAAYNQAISENSSLSPAIGALQDRLKENEIRLAMLMEESKMLEAEALLKRSESSLTSPRQFSHGHRGMSALNSHPSENVNFRSLSGVGSRSRKASS